MRNRRHSKEKNWTFHSDFNIFISGMISMCEFSSDTSSKSCFYNRYNLVPDQTALHKMLVLHACVDKTHKNVRSHGIWFIACCHNFQFLLTSCKVNFPHAYQSSGISCFQTVKDQNSVVSGWNSLWKSELVFKCVQTLISLFLRPSGGFCQIFKISNSIWKQTCPRPSVAKRQNNLSLIQF